MVCETDKEMCSYVRCHAGWDTSVDGRQSGQYFVRSIALLDSTWKLIEASALDAMTGDLKVEIADAHA